MALCSFLFGKNNDKIYAILSVTLSGSGSFLEWKDCYIFKGAFMKDK